MSLHYNSSIDLPFLNGGGEMGELIREMDWNKTPLGYPDQWPQSLRSILSIMLNSRFPMFLMWGPELTCFYNDAFRPSLGINGKHPAILGGPAREAWAEIWDIIYPLIHQVMSGGGAVWKENQLVPFYRNGQLEDIYWTYSYSPVIEENGTIVAVHVICTETTNNVMAMKQMAENENRFRQTLMQVPMGITILKGENMIVEMANESYLDIVDHSAENFIGRSLYDSLPEVRATVEPILLEVLKKGTTYQGTEFEVPLNRFGKKETAYFNFVYQPFVEPDGSIERIIVVANEVTGLVRSKHSLKQSEQQFSKLVQQSPIAMTIFRGKDHIVEMANDEMFKTLWRKEPHEVIGKKILDVFPELKEQKYPELLNRVYTTGITHREKESVAFVQGNDGMKRFYLDFEYAPLYNTDGVIDALMISVYNVTEKVEARLQIEQSENKFRSLADSMPQYVWTADNSGVVNYYSRSFFEYTGLTEEQLFADEQGWLQFIHPDDQQPNLRVWLNSVKTGQPFLFENRFRRYDGAYRWQLSRGIPLKNADGEIEMWVGTSTDIDELKKHQEDKDNFIRIASHELKTPVTTIKAYVQLLLSKLGVGDDPFLKKSLSTIDRQINKLTKLITDLLDVTRIEMGNFGLEKKPVHFQDLLHDAIDTVQATTSTHSIEILESPELLVEADKDRLSQVIINLLTNAIKYSPGQNKVIVRVWTDNNKLFISVEDFGIGMASTEYDRIFERFYRAANVETHAATGFGIGLFIVKEIVTQHQGEVWVESKKGEGSVFTFYIPVQ